MAAEVPAQPPSAARRVWDFSHIRQMILQGLARDDLARCIRLEKASLHDVAKELYRVVEYARWESQMSKDMAQRKYCAAISEINASSYTLPEAILHQLSIPADLFAYAGHNNSQAYYLAEYQPKVMALLLPHMKGICPSLRTISFVDEAMEGLGWAVHLSPTSPESPISLAGHIEYSHTLVFSVSDIPPTSINCPPPPSHNFTINHRFNLVLAEPDDEVGPALTAKWLAAFRKMPGMCDVHEWMRVNYLPLELEDIVSLYQRQSEAGHSRRLSEIYALGVRAWTIPQFRSLAQIASGSLTALWLADRYDPTRTAISFADLSDLTLLIRVHLPNLSILHAAINGPAEALCQDQLHDDILCEYGPLEDLVIYTGDAGNGLFNAVRVCGPVMSAQYHTLSIRAGTGWDWEEWEERQLLAYLRKQPRKRRVHLATVSFPALDVYTPEQAKLLMYHHDGRPKAVLEDRSAEWAEVAKRAVDQATSTLLPNLEGALREYSAAADRVREMKAAQKGGPELLDEVLKLAEALYGVQIAAEDIMQMEVMKVGVEVCDYASVLEKAQEE